MWKLLKAYIGIAIMYKYFNPNPCGKNVSDCTVRAICKATGKDWGEVYLRLCMRGYLDGDLPNANACWGAYLRSLGYRRYIIPDTCLSGHVVCVQDGIIYDSWNSENEIPLYFWDKETEE